MLGNSPTRQHLGVVLHHALLTTVLFDQLGNASLGGGGFSLDFPVPHLGLNPLFGFRRLCALGAKGSSTYVYTRTSNGTRSFGSSSVQHVNQRFFGGKLITLTDSNLTSNLRSFLQAACQTFTRNCLGRFLERGLGSFFTGLPFYGLRGHLLNQSGSRAKNRVERTGHNTDGQRCAASLFEVVNDRVGALILGKLRQFFL